MKKPSWWPASLHDDRWVTDNYCGPWWWNALCLTACVVALAIVTDFFPRFP